MIRAVRNMAESKEWSEKFRVEIIALYKKGKGYKTIAKTLNVPKSTVLSIVHKF